jgi:hypothetical protein
MHYLKFLLLPTLLIISGCSSNLMQPANDQAINKAQTNQVNITFIRSSILGSAIQASVYDTTNNEIVFIGVISNSTKINYLTTPGKHRFMVISETADFMEADVTGGKNYYAIVTPRMGLWKARFSMYPIRNSSSGAFTINSNDFKSWMKDTTLVTKNASADAWFTKNLADIKEKESEDMAEWKEKSAADIAERTLNPNDGI